MRPILHGLLQLGDVGLAIKLYCFPAPVSKLARYLERVIYNVWHTENKTRFPCGSAHPPLKRSRPQYIEARTIDAACSNVSFLAILVGTPSSRRQMWGLFCTVPETSIAELNRTGQQDNRTTTVHMDHMRYSHTMIKRKSTSTLCLLYLY